MNIAYIILPEVDSPFHQDVSSSAFFSSGMMHRAFCPITRRGGGGSMIETDKSVLVVQMKISHDKLFSALAG